jgi:hypothetical protein
LKIDRIPSIEFPVVFRACEQFLTSMKDLVNDFFPFLARHRKTWRNSRKQSPIEATGVETPSRSKQRHDHAHTRHLAFSI